MNSKLRKVRKLIKPLRQVVSQSSHVEVSGTTPETTRESMILLLFYLLEQLTDGHIDTKHRRTHGEQAQENRKAQF
jgi:hypothetical protein